MTNTKEGPTLKIILADESETEVSLLWLKTHSKMIQTMFLSSVGPDDTKSITLSEVRDLKQFEQIKSTIDGDLSWLMDSKIQNKGLGSLYLAIWRTMSYLDAGFEFNWDSLNQYTIKDSNLLRILFLLDLLLDSSNQLKGKIKSKILQLFEQTDQDDIRNWETSFHSIVSGLISIGSELVDIRLILDRIFQQCNLTLDKTTPFKNKFDLNHQFIPRLKEMIGSAWPLARNLTNKNIWPEGMILAGGSVITCCTDRDKSKIEASEDLDFWIYGPTEEERKIRFKTALKYLTGGVENEVIFSAKYCVVSLILPGDKVRMIQLIYTDKTSPEAAVNQFDFGYVRCYYDGINLYGTDEARIALELGIIDIDPEKIKPHRLYKIFRYPFKFNRFDSTVNQLEERFGSQEKESLKESPKEIDNQSHDSGWIEKMKDRLVLYDDVQKDKQKYVHLPEGLNSERQVHLVSTILGGNFTTKSLNQLCQNISYQPFSIRTYSDSFQMVGDHVFGSGLLIDFSQIPVVYQAQIKRILPRIKSRPIVELSPDNLSGNPVSVKFIELCEPIVVRFHNLVVTSSFQRKLLKPQEMYDIHYKTFLNCYIYHTDKCSSPLTNTLISLNKELFKRGMYTNGIMKNCVGLGVYKEMDKIDQLEHMRFKGITNVNDEDDYTQTTEWTLGFRIQNPNIIQGEISSSMIIDVDIIFKGWTKDKGWYFGSRKAVKSLTVRKNLSPLFRPGKEVIGQPWNDSYETRDH